MICLCLKNHSNSLGTMSTADEIVAYVIEQVALDGVEGELLVVEQLFVISNFMWKALQLNACGNLQDIE